MAVIQPLRTLLMAAFFTLLSYPIRSSEGREFKQLHCLYAQSVRNNVETLASAQVRSLAIFLSMLLFGSRALRTIATQEKS